MLAGSTGAPSTIVIVNEPSGATAPTETVWCASSEVRICEVRDVGPAVVRPATAASVSERRGSCRRSGAGGAVATGTTSAGGAWPPPSGGGA